MHATVLCRIHQPCLRIPLRVLQLSGDGGKGEEEEKNEQKKQERGNKHATKRQHVANLLFFCRIFAQRDGHGVLGGKGATGLQPSGGTLSGGEDVHLADGQESSAGPQEADRDSDTEHEKAARSPEAELDHVQCSDMPRSQCTLLFAIVGQCPQALIFD